MSQLKLFFERRFPDGGGGAGMKTQLELHTGDHRVDSPGPLTCLDVHVDFYKA